MLTVIGAGLPRTATTSLKAALERLGFGPCHHMFEILHHPEQGERWRDAMSGEAPDWDRVFEGYRAAVDFPAALYWRELASAYPEAKIILTARDPRRWHASMQNLFQFRPGVASDPATGALPEQMRGMAAMGPYMEPQFKKVLGDRWEPGSVIDEEYAVEAFHRHTEAVQTAIPAERLLVFEASQGWGPLCEFLGVDAPEEPFPHLNDAETVQRLFADLSTAASPTSPPSPEGAS
jgi:hypothetical protein